MSAKLYCQWSGGVQRPATLEAGDVQDATVLAAKVQTAIASLSGPHTVNVTAFGNRLKLDCPGLTGSETFTVFARPSLLTGLTYATPQNGFLDACGLIGALT